ncbi:MAG: hypothetical protein HKO72_03680 [Flavobacteriaceae bacterium]|nr:hypothetical protein [Flavobacteriaceae bacterium]
MIVGASKSGTTSLASHLNQNKGIFICEPKEPKFLTYSFRKNKYRGPGDDRTLNNCVKSTEEYLQLFKEASMNSCKGEASVDMLYHHKKVIPIIKEQIGDPKIIIMLRNPAKRAFSAYSHLIRDSRETLSFDEGLAKEQERLQNGFEFIWAYKNEGYYFEPVKDYLENFTNVEIIIFEDYLKNQQRIVNTTLNFLGIQETHHIGKGLQNLSGKPRHKFINDFFVNESTMKSFIKRILPDKLKYGLKNFVQKRNLQKLEPENELIDILNKEFMNDINKLETLIEIDLSIWKA